jgi:fructokinase
VIVVCGEALVDLTPADCPGERAFTARPGGSPANVAVGLGRLEVPVAFLGRLSTDSFGHLLRDHLTSNGVDPTFLREGPEPTTLAVVQLEGEGEPGFRFYSEGTASRLLLPRDLPEVFPAEVLALHFASISLVEEPGATTLERCMERERPQRVITIDPNVRPAVIDDHAAYLQRLSRWLALVDIVKVSRADLAWLHPGEPASEIAKRWLRMGPRLVVITRAEEGSVAFAPDLLVECPAPPVDIVDTVGAGDAFMSGLLAALHDNSLLQRDRLAHLTSSDLATCLGRAALTAALTCARAGAQPPTRAEVDAAEQR